MLETRAKEWEKRGIEKGIEKGIAKGIEKGIEKGIKKANELFAKKMIKNDESDERIAFYTGLSIKQITEIRESIKKRSDKQE
jgi:predicted transposase/invertase (TIGR01784 family)